MTDLGYPEMTASEHRVVFPYTGDDGEMDYEVTEPETVWSEDGVVKATYIAGDRAWTTSDTVSAVIPLSMSDEEMAAILTGLRAFYDDLHGVTFLTALLNEVAAS